MGGPGLNPELGARARLDIPRHVAIVMDGNGRWATGRGLPRPLGHVEGVHAATRTYRKCRELGVGHLTLYAFSVANWRRPESEVAGLMELFAKYAALLCDDFLARGIRFNVIGELDSLPEATRRSLQATSDATADQSEMTLSMAIAYGGRRDLLRGIRALLDRARTGALQPEELDETMLRAAMSTDGLPDPDLMIRTGGELRLSDFLVVESAYTELVFSDVLWPDFGEHDLLEAFEDYGRRERRFGDVRAATPVDDGRNDLRQRAESAP